MLHPSRLACLSLLVAACGDNITDATPDAQMGETRAIISAGNFGSTGVLSTIGIPSMTVVGDAVGGVVGGDPVMRRIGRELFIVNRSQGDNVTILDAYTLQLVGDQLATGVSSNPQDVAVVGRKLYLPLYGDNFAGKPGKTVLVLDRDDPSFRREIDLGSLDPDGAPDCVSAYAVGTQVYVACGLLEGFVPVRNGRVVVIDSKTDTVTSDFDLGQKNPLGVFHRLPGDSRYGGDLVIAAVPSYMTLDGCLARVKVGAAPAGNGCVADNATLGGYTSRAEVSLDGKTLWLAVVGFTDGNFDKPYGFLRTIDLATGALSEVLTPATQVINDVAVCPGGYLVASDTAVTTPGVRVWRDNAELTTAPLVVGRRPSTVGSNLTCL